MWSHTHKKEINESMKWFRNSFADGKKWIRIDDKEIFDQFSHPHLYSCQMQVTGMDAQYAAEEVKKRILLLFNNKHCVKFYLLNELIDCFLDELSDGSYCMKTPESLSMQNLKEVLNQDPILLKYLNFELWMERSCTKQSDITYNQFKEYIVEKEEEDMTIWL